MYEELIAGAASEPITVAEQAAWSRFDAPDQLTGSPAEENPDYDLVASQIKGAREEVERLSRYCCLPQQWRQVLPAFPGAHYWMDPVYDRVQGGMPQQSIELLRRPVQSIELIQYLATDGTLTTLDPATYTLGNNSVILNVGQTWPVAANRDNSVRVEYTAGYNPDGSPPVEIPERLKTAIKFLAGWWYENRLPVGTQPTTDIANTLKNILTGFRPNYLARPSGANWYPRFW